MKARWLHARISALLIALLATSGMSLSTLAYANPSSDTSAIPLATMVQNLSPIGNPDEYYSTLPTGFPEDSDESQSARNNLEVRAAHTATPPQTPHLCGAGLTPQLPDSLTLTPSNKLSASNSALNEDAPLVTYEVGAIRNFKAMGRSEGFDTTLVAMGERFTIWIETTQRHRITDEEVQLMAHNLDVDMKLIEQSFGSSDMADLDHDGKVAFVFHEFDEAMGDSAGYFSAVDLFSVSDLEQAGLFDQAKFTNTADLLHLNFDNYYVQPGVLVFDATLAQATIVHEAQHLIHFDQTSGQGETWLNEVFSQASVAITGYGKSVESYLWGVNDSVRYSGYTPPFIFEGSFVPSAQQDYEKYYAGSYGQWYLFGRYLSHQTKNLPRGGDSIYQAIFDFDRDEWGFGTCTIESVVGALKNTGYLGDGADAVARNWSELIENYNRALLVRDTTGPYSLTNNANAHPSVIDGASMELLSLPKTPLAHLSGGGAVTFSHEQSTLASPGNESSVIAATTFTSPLPLHYNLIANPQHGYLNEHSLVTLDLPQLTLFDDAYLTYAVLTNEQHAAGPHHSTLSYTRYTEPLPPLDIGGYLFKVMMETSRGYVYCGTAGGYRLIPTTPGGEEPENPIKPGGGSEESATPPSSGAGNTSLGTNQPQGAPLATTGDATIPGALTALVFAVLAAVTLTTVLVTRRINARD